MSTRRTRPSRLARWQQHVLAKAYILRHECERLCRQYREDDQALRQFVHNATAKHLEKACEAAGVPWDSQGNGMTQDSRVAGRRSRIHRLANAWTGAAIEGAFDNLHAAQVVLANLYSEEDVRARSPDALARLQSCLPKGDQRRIQAERLLGEQGDPAAAGGDAASRPRRDRRNKTLRTVRGVMNQRTDAERIADAHALRRAALRDAMQLGYDVQDQQYAQVRSFRNVLIVTTVLLIVLVVAVCFVGAVWPSAIPLCFQPEDVNVCPSTGGTEPDNGDVAVVALMGLLGGALSATFTIQKLRGTRTPYAIPAVLSFLKVPAGALTAVVGLVLVHGRFIPGLTDLDTQGQILAYAVVLGVAQHLVTRLVDRKAEEVLNSVPTKETRPTSMDSGGDGPARDDLGQPTSLTRSIETAIGRGKHPSRVDRVSREDRLSITES